MVENMPLLGRTMNQNIQRNPLLARNGTGSKTSKINALSVFAMLARNSQAPQPCLLRHNLNGARVQHAHAVVGIRLISCCSTNCTPLIPAAVSSCSPVAV
jgi:hypothetical protein